MKVLLINPPLENIDVERGANFPLGLAYIAKALREENCRVKVLDILINRLSKEKTDDYLKNNQFDIIGLTGMISSFQHILDLSKRIKKIQPNALLVAGGSLITTAPETVIKHSAVDLGIIGEGEKVIKNLVNKIRNKESFFGLNGLIYKKGEEIIVNPRQERIENIDSIGFPAWELFEMEKYLNVKVPLLDLEWKLKKRWINIATSRGCPFGCTYCGKTFGRITRLRSAENIIKEIQELIKLYNINHVNFCDDFFGEDKKRVLKICGYLAKMGEKITWTASLRVDSVDDEILASMKKANCLGLCFGIESGSQKILDTINKKTSTALAAKAVQLAEKYKIYTHCSIMIGARGETKDTIEETKNFIKKNKIYPIPINFITPLPGSPLYKEAENNGLIKNEYEYLKQLNTDFNNNLAVNISGLPDEELISLKNKTETELRRNYILRHPIWALKRLMFHLNYYGLATAFKKFKKNILAEN